MNIHQQIDPKNWAQAQFSEVNFSDKRRTQRLIKIATHLASHPGLSIPQQFENSYDIKATYNLFKHPKSKPKLLQSHHNEIVLKNISKEGVYLLIEDTTQLSWSGQAEKKGLGSIASGEKGEQGFLLHSTLAVKWSAITNFKRPNVEVIGLANQEYYFRPPKSSIPKKEKEREKFGFGEEYNGETELWNKILKKLSVPNKKVRWVRVCDRGADIYEVLLNSYENGYGFVIRACQDRVLEEDGKERLFARARKGKILGEYQIELRSRKEHFARMVTLELSVSQLRVRSPRRKGAEPGSLPGINLNIVRVVEKNNENDPIEWILLCDKEINTFESALEVVLQYSSRWIIEEFHKALKTGLGVEKLQLETADRLVAASAIYSIVALRLVDMRERWRLHTDERAEDSGLTEEELNVLRKALNRKIETQKDVALAIGRLGGHMNRKGDGMPGMLTLWRGMQKLQFLIEGYRLKD